MFRPELAGESRIDAVIEAALRSDAVRAEVFKILGWLPGQCAGNAKVILNEPSGTGDHAGEDDLKLLLDQKPRILFENKFNADFQPRQGLRYRERARAHSTASDLPVATILSAPIAYIASRRMNPELRAFDKCFGLGREWVTFIRNAVPYDNSVESLIAEIQRIENDCEMAAFQAVKGRFTQVHQAIWSAAARVDNGWFQEKANDGDWVHLHHAETSDFKFHYRIRKAQVDVEVVRKELCFNDRAIESATENGWEVRPQLRNVVIQLAQGTISDGSITISPRSADQAIKALGDLLAWATAVNRLQPKHSG